MTAVCCPPAPIPTHQPWWRAAWAAVTAAMVRWPRGHPAALGVGFVQAGARQAAPAAPPQSTVRGCTDLAASLGQALSRDIGLPEAAREQARSRLERDALMPWW